MVESSIETSGKVKVETDVEFFQYFKYNFMGRVSNYVLYCSI